MKQILIDTNVLVSFLTDRDPEQQDQAADLFTRAADGEHEVVLHQIAMTEMAYVLRNVYGVAPPMIALTLRELLALPGVMPVDEISWPLLLEIWPEQIPNFGDAALASVAEHLRYDEVATFDSRFSKKLAKRGIVRYWS